MHDIKEIRENLKEFSNQTKKRNVDVKFDEIIGLDKENRSLIARVGKDKECIVEDYTASKHGGLGNVYYSDGIKGEVIYLKIKKRIGNFHTLSDSKRFSGFSGFSFQKHG